MYVTALKLSLSSITPVKRCLARGFSKFPVLAIKSHKLPPRPKINEDEIKEAFMKGGRGPGGQKINKTNSKVQLKHIPTGIVVTCQATRSQEQNRKKAREILAMKVQHALDPENSRQAVVGEWKSRKTNSKRKKAKRKYRKLEEEKKKAMEEQEGTQGTTTKSDTTNIETGKQQEKTPVADALSNAIMNSVD